MHKTIFLDCDGVMNSGNYIKRLDGDFDDPINQMDVLAVARLNAITDATNAVIVVSSTWRLAFINTANALCKLQECMASYKITAPIVGMTPELQSTRNRRGKEIQSYIDDHYYEISKFIIIDDDVDIGKLKNRFIKTLFQDGLQDCHVAQAIEMLNETDII